MSVMAVSSGPGFSVASLFDDREKTRRREAEDEARLKQKNDEELAAFRKRLDEFTLTEANVQAVMDRVRLLHRQRPDHRQSEPAQTSRAVQRQT
jgi:hypothetical protein